MIAQGVGWAAADGQPRAAKTTLGREYAGDEGGVGQQGVLGR